MLKGTFFKIDRLTRLENEPGHGVESERYLAEIKLNPEHQIYQGHFPGNPAVPGVCQIRMITEILSEIEEREVKLKEADNVKFLSMINPHDHPALEVTLTLKHTAHRKINVNASIADGGQLFFKYKSSFK
ncbi:MAG: 3-hydroxyacyl-ACP dehydratase [Bacteroidales bacterium]|nr:3-hydroxyacyl-ACP dehydratase [Bacteroidota bacterium]MBL6949791.1 3-hydroxyacyl-ACP dehydratase [Bacteroidales bacterium]